MALISKPKKPQPSDGSEPGDGTDFTPVGAKQEKQPKQGPGRVKRAQMSTIAVVRAVVIVMLTVFAMQNLSTVSVRFLFWSADIPVFSVALLVGIVGLVLGYFSGNRNTTRRLKAK